MNYYNEFDAKTAAWLRELIKHGHIPPGDVDERDIREVQPSDLAGYTQCHFFAGIAGWPYALQLAGWDVDRPVWTGSCPCQPFSCAGKGLGTKDERHLWPEFARLISECRPATVFGEQVADAIGKGWLDIAFDDLEGAAYACASAVLRASAIGAASQRKRLFWVASHIDRARGPRLVKGQDTGVPGQRNWRGEEDLRAIAERPLERGDLWPQPIVRRVDDGIPARVVCLRGFGNAIDPRLAAQFIIAAQEAMK